MTSLKPSCNSASEIVGAKFADFGTRRRYSYTVQDFLVEDMIKFAPDNFVGTSNVYFAMMRGTKPIGTQAHEWFMFHGAKYGFKMANRLALDNWVEVYRGDLGIALTDTFTSKNFNMREPLSPTCVII